MTLSFASTARASCTDLPAQRSVVLPTAFRLPLPAAKPTLARTSLARMTEEGPPIVGLWQFTFTSVGNSGNPPPFNPPDDVVLDAGFAQWHSDGTEIMNSGRDPVTGSFCLGTWTNIGHQTYRLNHYAITWDNTGHFCTPAPPATNCMVGLANIREEVTMEARGDSYSGTVTITQYDTANHKIFQLTGKVSGRRINPN